MSQLVLLRNSERSTYRRCRQKWEWSYVRKLEPKLRAKPLTFGTMVHQALAAWYVPGKKRGQHPAEAFIEIYDADAEEKGRGFDQWDDDGNKVDARELGWAMLNGYVEQYGKDDKYTILQSEMTFQIDVYDKQGRYLCTFVGSVDGPARNRDTGKVVLFEHKTAKAIQDVRINSGYGEQGLTYWWALNTWLHHTGELKEGELIDEVLFNFLRKGFPDARPRNAAGHYLNLPKKDALVAALAARDLYLPGKPTMDVLSAACVDHGIDPSLLGEPSAKQPRPLFDRQPMPLGPNELHNFERRLRMDAYEMQFARTGKLPINKNPTKDCDWDCPFKFACEVHEMGGDYETILEYEFKEWDPYEAHELALMEDD